MCSSSITHFIFSPTHSNIGTSKKRKLETVKSRGLAADNNHESKERSNSFVQHRRSWTAKAKSDSISPFSATSPKWDVKQVVRGIERQRSMSYPASSGDALDGSGIGDILGGFVHKLEESLTERISEMENRLMVLVHSQIKGEGKMKQSTSFEPQTSGTMGFNEPDLDDDELLQSVSFNIEHDDRKTPPAL